MLLVYCSWHIVSPAVQADAHDVPLHGLVVRGQIFLRLGSLPGVPLNIGDDLVIFYAGAWNDSVRVLSGCGNLNRFFRKDRLYSGLCEVFVRSILRAVELRLLVYR